MAIHFILAYKTSCANMSLNFLFLQWITTLTTDDTHKKETLQPCRHRLPTIQTSFIFVNTSCQEPNHALEFFNMVNNLQAVHLAMLWTVGWNHSCRGGLRPYFLLFLVKIVSLSEPRSSSRLGPHLGQEPEGNYRDGKKVQIKAPL